MNYEQQLDALLEHEQCGCSKCGYDLRATITSLNNACPECGQTYRLSTTKSKQKNWIYWYGLVLCTSALFGGSSLYLLYIFIRGFSRFISKSEANAMVTASVLTLIAMIMLGLKRDYLLQHPHALIKLGMLLGIATTIGFVVWWLNF